MLSPKRLSEMPTLSSMVSAPGPVTSRRMPSAGSASCRGSVPRTMSAVGTSEVETTVAVRSGEQTGK